MSKKKNKENFLEWKPLRSERVGWSVDDDCAVTLEIENRGFFNRLFQFLLKKPKISFVHLDEMGSFLWPRLDGEKDLVALGDEVKAQFGEKAEPLYERLAKYIQILHSYGFISLK